MDSSCCYHERVGTARFGRVANAGAHCHVYTNRAGRPTVREPVASMEMDLVAICGTGTGATAGRASAKSGTSGLNNAPNVTKQNHAL
jgi:hypothetical protein